MTKEDGKAVRADRLRRARRWAGFDSASEFARALNMKVSTYGAYESGQNGFNMDEGARFARRLGIAKDWLMFGEGRDPTLIRRDINVVPIDDAGNEIDNGPAGAGNGTIVPELDVRAGANYAGGMLLDFANVSGEDASLEEKVRARWIFPRSYMRDELHISRPVILPVRGNSMEPLLFDGDRAVCDLDDVDLGQGGIFSLLDDIGSVIIKQVEIVRGKRDPMVIRCKSLNSTYDPFDLKMVEPVKIIGRVATKITRIGI